jgi:glycosyltransferase involved in cell wall biosynthesis
MRVQYHRNSGQAYFRHGQEKALYDSPVFDTAIDMLLHEHFRWYCVSSALAEDLLQRGQRALVVPNGVDLTAFAAAVPSLPARARPLRVLVEGPAWSPFKRVEETIAMLRTLDVEIVHMAADGSRPQMPIDYALGAVPHEDVPNAFVATDLIVKLSARESFAMPVLEQFAAGGIAIVAAFPGHESYIRNGVNALVVDSDDPFPAAHAALSQLLTDSALLARLRHSARATARPFSWTSVGADLLRDLLACIRSHRNQPSSRLDLVTAYRPSVNALLALWAKGQQSSAPYSDAGRV